MLENVPITWVLMIVLGWLMGIILSLVFIVLHLGKLTEKIKRLMEEYYLIKKSDVDFYHDLFENFRKEHKEDEIGAGAKDSLFGIANVLADAKLIDLSDEAIDKLKWEFVAKTNNDLTWSEGKAYSQALKDLKRSLK